MKQYILRLDDASEYMDVKKWMQIEQLLDKYQVKPLVGVIPDNKDPDMINVYSKNENFWQTVHRWEDKGWTIAMHGYSHVFETNEGGINPVNLRSEFAGVSLERQKGKIRSGCDIMSNHGFAPKVFFAPAHTFDRNTLIALKEESDIRIISDTIANDIYYEDGFYFIPQQSGHVRNLPFSVVTFCYHPNYMKIHDFDILEPFLKRNRRFFCGISEIRYSTRNKSLFDKLLNMLYFGRRIRKNGFC